MNISEIAKNNSISKAADKLFITQPALSKYLQKIENELGTPLFHRVGKKFIPTSAGEIYLERSAGIIRLNSQIEQEINDLVSMRSGNIRIGTTGGRASYIAKCIVPDFLQKYKDIKIVLDIRHTDELINKVINNELDIVVASVDKKKADLNYSFIGEEELVLVVSENNTIISKSEIIDGYKYPVVKSSILENYDFIQLPPTSKSPYLAQQYFISCGISPKTVAQFQDVRTVIDAVSVGIGIGIFVSVPLKGIDNIRYLSLENCNVPKQKTAIITRQGIYLNSAKKDLMDLIKQTYN